MPRVTWAVRMCSSQSARDRNFSSMSQVVGSSSDTTSSMWMQPSSACVPAISARSSASTSAARSIRGRMIAIR